MSSNLEKKHPILIVSIIEIEQRMCMCTFQINCCNNAGPVQVKRCDVLKLMNDVAKNFRFDPSMKICESFIVELLSQNQNAVFEILESSQSYSCSDMKKKCMAIILDDPMKCFQHPEFLIIKEETLKLILSEPKINCTHYTLLRAAKKWFAHNGQVEKGKLNDVYMYKILKEKFGIEEGDLCKQMYNIRDITDVENEGIKKFQTINLSIGRVYKYYMHGIVLNIGVHPEMDCRKCMVDDYFMNEITIKFSIKHQWTCFKKVVVTHKLETSIVKIMFAKALIPFKYSSASDNELREEYDKLRIQVELGNKKYLGVVSKVLISRSA